MSNQNNKKRKKSSKNIQKLQFNEDEICECCGTQTNNIYHHLHRKPDCNNFYIKYRQFVVPIPQHNQSTQTLPITTTISKTKKTKDIYKTI